MADHSATTAENNEFFDRLEKSIDKRRIAEYLRDKHGKEIIRLVIAHAKMGLGPDDAPYPPYSPAYAARFGKAAERAIRYNQGQYRDKSGKVIGRIKDWHNRVGADGETNTAGTKFPLRGIGRTGNAGGMLDPANFSWEIDADNVLWLVWTASDERMAIYGEVHQDGLPLGRNGPRKQRKWMHLEWQAADEAVVKWVENAVDALVEEFNRGA